MQFSTLILAALLPLSIMAWHDSLTCGSPTNAVDTAHCNQMYKCVQDTKKSGHGVIQRKTPAGGNVDRECLAGGAKHCICEASGRNSAVEIGSKAGASKVTARDLEDREASEYYEF